MKRILSSAALVSILFGAIGPVFGQRLLRTQSDKSLEREEARQDEPNLRRPLVKKPRPLPPSQRKQTRFDKVESFTEGSGAYVRWVMESEQKNAGFRVYRLDGNGETPIAGFIPGSWLKVGDEVLTGAEYHAYDPKGSLDYSYFVEALGDDGKTLRSQFVSPQYIDSIENIPGGTKIKTSTFAAREGESRVSQDLLVSSELKNEMQRGLLVPDPNRHREVISMPGGVHINARVDGLIRVTKAELQAGGFDVNSDSTNWQIYMDGNELPMIVAANADYIEFFGKGIDTVESDFRTYYLVPGTGPGRRIPSQTVRPPLSSVVSRKYSQTFVRDDRATYTSQSLNGAAENWYATIITSTFPDYKFNLSGVDRTAGTRKMSLSFEGFSLGAHSVQLTLNGTLVGTIAGGSGRVPFEGSVDVPVSSLLDGENTLNLRAVAGGGDLSFLRRLRIDFPRSYSAMGNKLEFHTEGYKNSRLSGFTSPNIRVFDRTYENSPRQLTDLQIVDNGGNWGPVIPAGRAQVLYAAEAGVFGTASSVTPNNPTLLGDPSNAGTMVIIAHPSLMTGANAWGAYRSGQGVVTKVVDVTDIYDEYNYGVISSKAIEDFLYYAKNNWQTPPSYVLLLGDGHYDPRNYDSVDQGYWNMIPPRLLDGLYEQTASDEALSDFDDDGLAEIPIGRIPARTGAAVTVALNKVIAWESAVTSNSLNRGVLFAHDKPEGYDFKAMSDRIMANLPAAVPKLSISQETAGAQTQIINAVNELDGGTSQAPGTNAGQYLLNYTGHGNKTAWRDANFFSSTQAPMLTNASFPSMMVALTCLNGYFLEDFEVFAEVMLNAGNGGAVAVWASTTKTTPDVQEVMGARFYLKLGEGNIPRLGDLIKDAKTQVPAQADVRLSWALVGDPMLKVR